MTSKPDAAGVEPSSAEPAGARPSPRLLGIDLLRGLAALAVVLSHLPLSEGIPPHPPRSLAWWVEVFQGSLGSWGVGLFFVLSGLCIHLPMAKRLARDPHAMLELRPYLRRRFTRIYPPHLIALLLSAAVAMLLTSTALQGTSLSKPTLLQFVLHLFMVHSFVPSAASSINAVLWTIAVETHFYLLYPLVLPAARRLGFARVTAVLFGVSIVSRVVAALLSPTATAIVEPNFIARYWEWTLGCWIAERLVVRGAPALSRSRIVGLLLASVAFSPIVRTLLRMTLGLNTDFSRIAGNETVYLLLPFVCALVVLYSCGIPGSAARNRFISHLDVIGRESYSLYLTHPISIALWMTALFSVGVPRLLVAISSLVVAVGGGRIFFHVIEKRFLIASRRGAAMPTPGSTVTLDSRGDVHSVPPGA